MVSFQASKMQKMASTIDANPVSQQCPGGRSCPHNIHERPWVRRRLCLYQDRWAGHQCQVTNSEEEMKDPRNPITNHPNVVKLAPEYQIPNPELGPLEQRVSKTYIEAMYSDEVSVEDTNYWFTEPEGGWNSEVKYGIRLREETPLMMNATHLGEGRTNLEDLNVGDVLEGEVSCLMYFHGVQVDIGAQYDGLIPVRKDEWVNDHFRAKFGVSSGVSEDFEIGQKVKVQIWAINLRPRCRFPIQLVVLEPDVQHKILHPLLFNFSFDLRGVKSWGEACAITGRPLPEGLSQSASYIPMDKVSATERQMRSKELSQMSYGTVDVKFDGMVQQPPIGMRIESEAQQRHADCIEPWKVGYKDGAVNDETDEILEEVL